MKTKTNYRNICLIILLTVLLACTVFFAMLYTISASVAYAGQFYSVTKSDYYKDYSSGSLETTDYYREAGVTNNVVQYGLSNNVFSFSSGASVMKNDLNTLVFQFNLDNPNYESYLGHGSSKEYDNALIVFFDVYSCSKDGTSASLAMEFAYSSVATSTSGGDLYGLRRFQYGTEKVGLVDCYNGVDKGNDFSDVASILLDNSLIQTSIGNSDVDFQYLGASNATTSMRWVGKNEKHVNFALTTSSAYTRYFVRAQVLFQMDDVMLCGSGTSFSCIDSSVVSVADVLGNMQQKDGFGSLSSTKQTEAEKILTEGSYETVQIQYLKRIGETPFAESVTEYVSVPVVNQVIKPQDVATSLGVATLAVMQSACESFTYDSKDNIYRAKYLKSVWLSAKTADGNNKDYFLDCNVSYKDYYHQLVDDGIFDEGAYEWLLNRIFDKFPDVYNAGITADNLYGYFGYVVMPETHTINEWLFDMFDGGQSHFEGTVDQFCTQQQLEWDSYKKLLDDYEYTWLEKAWNAVAGFVQGSDYNAYHYFFYVDSGITEAFIANNGASSIYDNMSHFGITTKEAVEDIADAISDLWLQYQEILQVVLGGIGIFVLLFAFFSISTKTFRLKSAINRFKASRKEKQNAYAVAEQRQRTYTTKPKKRTNNNKKQKYRRG